MFSWPTFLNPERLWILLLVPALVVGYLVMLRLKKRVGMRFTNTSLLAQVMPRQSQWRRHLAVALSLLSLMALSFAWARPNGIEMVPRERATVVLVIDISQSMAATDVKPNRLEAAKQAAVEFVSKLPAKYNLSVVSLSGSPSVRLPPTVDRTQARLAIQSLKVQDSTAVGESVYVGLDALKMAPAGADGDTSPAPGAIVLLSDGQNTAGRSPVQSALAAKQAGVPIYTIAYGTPNGYVDLDGTRETVPPDPQLLSALASDSGGRAYTAEDLSQLSRVYDNIRSEVGQTPTKKETTAIWAGYGLAFAVVAALAAVSLGGEMALIPTEFMRPDRLWWLLIIPTLVALYLFLLWWRRRRSKAHSITNLERVLPQQQAWKRHLAVGLAILALAALNVAFAQPKAEVDVPRDRATIVLTLDVSLSMQATDVAPNRLDAAKAAAKEFLQLLPTGFNVALVRFAGTPAVVVPPTSDRGVVAAAIDRLQVAPYTAIGEGVYSSLDAIAQAPPDPNDPEATAPGAIVLLSDGFTNIGRDSADAAREAKAKNIPVYTIAYGTANGYLIGEGGQQEPVPVNHAELSQIARLSGGKKFSAGSSEELRQVYASIARSVGYVKADQEVTETYAGYAVGFAALAVLAMMSLAARWP